jgi:hypothetical protein
VQPIDVILLDLASWEGASQVDQEVAEREQLLPAAAKLRQLAPALASVDRSRCQVELSISTIREEDQGGFELPAELIAAAAAGGLSLGISILVMLDDYDLGGNSANGEQVPHKQQPSGEPA